jgi:hypothetical protein
VFGPVLESLVLLLPVSGLFMEVGESAPRSVPGEVA